MIALLSLDALNHLLTQADWARAKLSPFAGRGARLAMPPLQIDFIIRSDGYVEPAAPGSTPDVVMTLPVEASLRAMQGAAPLMAAARVEGNAHLATELSFVLRNLRWDVEEDLSRLVGDIAAHRLVRSTQALAAWHHTNTQRFAENVAGCLTEENKILLRPQDLASHAEDLARLDETMTRLERRVGKLES